MGQITAAVVTRILAVVDHGLCSGLGEPIPGKMCVEAAVCYALSEPREGRPTGIAALVHALNHPHHDRPVCVAPLLRTVGIKLNDSPWSTNAARARGMRRLAIAQLGTKGTLDERHFVAMAIRPTVPSTLPRIIKRAAQLYPEPYRSKILKPWKPFRTIGTDAPLQQEAEYAVGCAQAIARDTTAAAGFAWCSQDEYQLTDDILRMYAEEIVQTLIQLQTPGSKFLFLTETN